MTAFCDIKDLIQKYERELERTDIDDKYVITADAMTVNKIKNRYHIENVDFPTIYDLRCASYRMSCTKNRNPLLNYDVLKYRDWLKKRIIKLNKLIDAYQNQITISADSCTNTPDEVKEPDVIESTETEFIIRQLVVDDCPARCYNCLCCKFAENITMGDNMVRISCTYKKL